MRKSVAEILSNVLTEAACAIVFVLAMWIEHKGASADEITETTKKLPDNEKHENK